MAQKENDIIWIVVNAEDIQGLANQTNAIGCRELCESRVDAQADMLYGNLFEQAMQLKEGARIIMHQGGARCLGGQKLLAAGLVKVPVQPLTREHVRDYRHLWEVTQRWYRRWPAELQDITNELIIFYNLTKADPAYSSPHAIRSRPGNKFIPLHPNCNRHNACAVYDQIDAWWHKTYIES